MPFYTPLRYPGGKRRLVGLVTRLLESNDMRDIEYAEPFAGGASLALALLFDEYAATIHINDLSKPVYAFWHCVLHDTDRLCRRIEEVDVTMHEWHRQRAVLEAQEEADIGELGFAAFFLNRTNRSGIISGGVIGGQQQTGDWLLDARFNQGDLLNRIRRVGRYRDRIKLYQLDALDFTNSVVALLGHNAFAFYDPPYIESGASLYLNDYKLEDHRHLAKHIMQTECSWTVTYDYDAAVTHDLFPRHRRLAFALSYSAQQRRSGKEAMFLSPRLRLPSEWAMNAEFCISAQGSEYPIFGRLEAMPTEIEEGPEACCIKPTFVEATATAPSPA